MAKSTRLFELEPRGWAAGTGTPPPAPRSGLANSLYSYYSLVPTPKAFYIAVLSLRNNPERQLLAYV